MKTAILLILAAIGLCAAQDSTTEATTSGRLLALPEKDFCLNRPRDWQFGNHNYYFSWDHEGSPDVKVDWLQARNECRKRCMDAVSMETEAENNMIFDYIRRRNVTYIWTSGRLCDFKGCETRTDLLPLNVLGWFWSSTNTKMAPTNSTPAGWQDQPWSQNGHTGGPQPDNAEFDINQTPESCMGVLNNIYNDGIKWHDIACYHKKPYICEDNDVLINYIQQTENVDLISPPPTAPNQFQQQQTQGFQQGFQQQRRQQQRFQQG